MALSAARTRDKMGNLPVNDLVGVGAKTNIKFYPGALVCLELATGLLVIGTAATGLVPLGVCDENQLIDMTGLTSGSKTIRIRPGIWKFTNSGGADAIATANTFADCFVVDDDTVALTDGNGARSRAGKVIQVDSDGVWVQVGLPMPQDPALNPKACIAIPVDLATLANAQTYNFTPKFPGRILGVEFVVRKPATTAAKAATAQIGIAGTPCTGGAVALTSAACTPAGAEVAGTAVTALNTFAAGQQCQIAISGVTAFIEGDGEFLIWLA